MSSKAGNAWDEKAMMTLLRRRRAGEAYSVIARDYGVKGAWIKELCDKARRLEDNEFIGAVPKRQRSGRRDSYKLLIEQRRADRESLSDAYIRTILKLERFALFQIPKELLDAERARQCIKRQLRSMRSERVKTPKHR